MKTDFVQNIILIGICLLTAVIWVYVKLIYFSSQIIKTCM